MKDGFKKVSKPKTIKPSEQVIVIGGIKIKISATTVKSSNTLRKSINPKDLKKALKKIKNSNIFNPPED